MNSSAPITARPVPKLEQTQLEKFTSQSIHAEEVMSLNTHQALSLLASKEGTQVIGADFGGDKGVTQLYTVKNGKLVTDNSYRNYTQGMGGAGYLTLLEEANQYAATRGIGIGISWGGPLSGTQPEYHEKFQVFHKELAAKYPAGGLSEAVPAMQSCVNDGVAGLISGAIKAVEMFDADNVLFPINGGGLGMSALVRDTAFSTEAGHVEAIGALNTYDQTKPCGVFGATYVCIETMGANKAGIEAQWEARTGNYMRARDIETEYKQGDVFAGDLYAHSAWVVAHMIAGTARALDIDLINAKTAVVGHGGGFKFPHYGERVTQILESELGGNVNFIATHEYGDSKTNACLDGAALGALLRK